MTLSAGLSAYVYDIYNLSDWRGVLKEDDKEDGRFGFESSCLFKKFLIYQNNNLYILFNVSAEQIYKIQTVDIRYVYVF